MPPALHGIVPRLKQRSPVADARVRVKIAALPTSGTTYDFTASGLGSNVKGGVFFAVRASALEEPATVQAAMGIGMTDGTRDRCVAVQSRHAQTTQDTYRIARNDRCMHLIANTGAINGSLSFNSFITDGVRFNVSDAFAAAYYMVGIMFAGTDVSFYVADSSTNALQNGVTTITAPGFQPTDVFVGSTFTSFGTSTTASADARLGFGVASDTGSGVTNLSQNWGYTDGTAGAAEVFAEDRSNRCFQLLNNSGASGSAQITTISSVGFSITTRDAAGSQVFMYGALKLPSHLSRLLEIVDTKTSTGDQKYQNSVFRPQAYLVMASALTTVDTHTTNDDASTYLVGAGSGTSTAHGCVAMSCDDGATTSDCEELASNTFALVHDATGADLYEITLDGFTSSGLDLNFGVANGTARKVILWTVQENHLVGSADGVASTPSSVLKGRGRLVGSADGVATTPSSILKGRGRLVGSADGIATPSSTLLGVGALSGSADGTATPSSTLLGAGTLVGSADGTSTPSSTLLGLGALSGSSDGVAAVDGTAALYARGQGSADGAASLDGTLVGTGALAGSADGIATPDATAVGTGALSGSADGIASPSSTLLGVGALSGSADGLASPDATLVGAGAMSGSADGTSTPAGTLVGTGALSGSADGIGSASGTMKQGAIAGSADGVATPSSTLVGLGALAGSADGTSALDATLLGLGALSGSSDGTSTLDGVLVGLGALVGSADGTASLDAVLVGLGALVGSADGIASLDGTLVGTGALAGSADGTSSPTGTLNSSSNLEGFADGIASADGVLVGLGALVGSADGVASLAGLLEGLGALSGSADGVGAADATLEGIGALAGSADGAGDATGTLTGLQPGLAGPAAGVASLEGVLVGSGALAGSADGVATASASAIVEGFAPPVDLLGRYDVSAGLLGRRDQTSDLEGSL